MAPDRERRRVKETDKHTEREREREREKISRWIEGGLNKFLDK